MIQEEPSRAPLAGTTVPHAKPNARPAGSRARRRGALVVAGLALLGGCAAPAAHDGSAPAAPDRFWAALSELCGRAFEGRVEESIPPDPTFEHAVLTMHVRECGEDEIRIPFHVDDDRSRTWVLTRTAEGLRLKHDHRHEDGTADEVTDYGGETRGPGTPERQEFPADDHTASLVPAAATNVWTLAIDREAGTFTYALRREGSERRFRAVFDLRRPVETPPPSWGAEGTGSSDEG